MLSLEIPCLHGFAQVVFQPSSSPLQMSQTKASAFILSLLAAASALAQDGPRIVHPELAQEQIKFFTEEVRQILAVNCFK